MAESSNNNSNIDNNIDNSNNRNNNNKDYLTRSKRAFDLIKDLPNEILSKVFQLLSSEDLAIAMWVCADWHNLLINDSALWCFFNIDHCDKATFSVMKSVSKHGHTLNYVYDPYTLDVKHQFQIKDKNISHEVSDL